ncbi:MAG: hypothetical protein VX689_01085 [Bacteroidota bacterium]|nr:hypothetical protein [Bacteroidota bacterium]
MKKAFCTLIIITVLLYACKEEDVINPPELNSTQSCQDNAIAENIFNDVGYIVEIGLQNNGQNKSCPSYNLMNADTSTVDTVINNASYNIDTLIIDFGSTNCLYNGKLRRGKINVTYTGKYRHNYSIIRTTFDNYYVNNNLIQGERIVTNQGINSSGNMWFTIEVKNASITTANGNGTINWESERVREWVNGENTYSNILDDEYKTTGTASGNGVNGVFFTMTIIDSLNIDLGCLPYSCLIKSGTVKVSPSGYSDRIINYGDSLCDCNADVSINGIIYPIVIGGN